jgi:2-iminobutanoate/2-iminopropanoate deaminase
LSAILAQMKHCLEAAGTSLDNVLKCNVYCVPGEGRFRTFNEIHGPDESPARIFIHVPSWPGPFDIEMDCVAVL